MNKIIPQSKNCQDVNYNLHDIQPFSLLNRSKEYFISYGYRKQRTILFIRMKKGKIKDIFPVKTLDTFKKIIQTHDDLLFLPNPVKIPREYWNRYRKAKTPKERIALAKEFGLLKDQQILVIEQIVLDIDSPYEEVEPVWKILVEKLFLEGYKVYKTKSGRFRVYIQVSGNTYACKVFCHSVKGKGRNHKSHLENVYEIQYILAAFFEKRGLNIDVSFIGRLNHPVLLEGRPVDGKKGSVLMEVKEGTVMLYDLYHRVKNLQKEEELWTFKGKNLTELFWKHKWRNQQKKQKLKKPDLKLKLKLKLGERLTKEHKLELALRKLSEKHYINRFKHVMLPVCGWARYLGLDEDFVYNLLRKYLPTKKSFDKDFQKAWRYSTKLTFKWIDKYASNEEFSKKVEKFLNACVEPIERKHVLKLFLTEAEYYEVERYLLKKEYIEVNYLKTGKKGRPPKIIRVTEKGFAFLKNPKEEEKAELTENTNLFVEESKRDFSHIYLSYTLKECNIGDNLYGLVDGWYLNLCKPYPSTPTSISDPLFVEKEKETQFSLSFTFSNSLINQIDIPSKLPFNTSSTGPFNSNNSLRPPRRAKKLSGSFKIKHKEKLLYTKEARKIALLLNYSREYLPKAIVYIARSIEHFMQENGVLLDAIRKTFAVYLYAIHRYGRYFVPEKQVSPYFEELSDLEKHFKSLLTKTILSRDLLFTIVDKFMDAYLERYSKDERTKITSKTSHAQRSLFDFKGGAEP